MKNAVETIACENLAHSGKRKKETKDTVIPSILEPERSSMEYRKKWARLIQKIYALDPLTSPKSQGRIKIISFIENKGLPGGLLQEFKTAPGGFDGCGFCYRSSALRPPRIF